MKSAPPGRWEESQRRELDFWRNWSELAPYQNLDVREYWAQELTRFDCPPHFFSGRRVLDLGCGPMGLIHFLDDAAERIRIDPLLHQYDSRMPLPDRQLSLAGIAEALPLASSSIDIVICFNALDHMRDPAAALREIRRVLRPEGSLLLMIHTFPAWVLPVSWIDRLHPHHWTAAGFTAQIGAQFTVEHSEAVTRQFAIPASKWLHPSSWKYHLANLLVKSTYVKATSPRLTAPGT